MRSRGVLRALALAALAVAARAGCKPVYTCDPAGSGFGAVCHATYACVFNTPCLMGAVCQQTFDVGDGVDARSGLAFNYSTGSDGSVIGGTLGGQSYCGPAGCDDNAITLTFQSADLDTKWVSNSCETKETPEQCRLGTKTPIPQSKALTLIIAQQHCLNQFTPCTFFKATAVIDFHANVAWPELPAPPPAASPPPPPPSSPPSPPAPPPAPGAFAKGGIGRKSLGACLLAFYIIAMLYAIGGYVFVRARARRGDSIETWPAFWVRCFPFRCSSEIAGGTVTSARSECELLWCWCVPQYWRHSERDVMDAYWAYHGVDGGE